MKVRCGNKDCKKYIEKDSAVHAGISYYCDNACLHGRSAPKRKKSAARSTTTRRRSSKKKPVPDSITESVLSRDGYTCRYCGGTNNLAVHHIHYRSEWKNKPWENQRSNLLSLCNEPCHLTIIHGNKNRYQRLCLGVVWLSEVENIHITIQELEKRENESNSRSI